MLSERPKESESIWDELPSSEEDIPTKIMAKSMIYHTIPILVPNPRRELKTTQDVKNYLVSRIPHLEFEIPNEVNDLDGQFLDFDILVNEVALVELAKQTILGFLMEE